MALFALIHIITSVRLDIFPALISFSIPLRNFQPFILGFSLHVNGETKKEVQQSRFKEGNLLSTNKDNMDYHKYLEVQFATSFGMDKGTTQNNQFVTPTDRFHEKTVL